MKKIFLGASLIATAFLFSCTSKKDENKDNTTVAGTSETMPANTTPAPDPSMNTNNSAKANITVPEKVKTEFKTKYPKATNETWNRYDPNYDYSYDWDMTGWPKMDTSYYTVNYDYDGGDYWVFYTPNWEWMSTVEPVKSTEVPDAVNKTLNAKYKNYTVESVNKENDKNREAYEIKLMNGQDKMKVLIDSKGNVMKAKGMVNGEKVKEKNV